MKLPEESRAVFTDAYRYYEEYWDKPDTVEAWTKRAEKLNEAVVKHGKSNLAYCLMMACYDAMDADMKEGRKKRAEEAERENSTEEQRRAEEV